MEENGIRRSRIAAILAAMTLVVAACSSSASSPSASAGGGGSSAAPPASPGGSGSPAASGGGTGELAGQTVTVIGTWGGDEEKAFKQMVAPWEQQTGAKVSYTGTRDLN